MNTKISITNKNMDFSIVCRTCLGNSHLKPIFDTYCRDFSTDLHTITGIKVETHDGLPQNMCVNCYNFVREAIAFRKKCKDIERQLFEQICTKNEVLVKCEVVMKRSDSDDEFIDVKPEVTSEEGVNCASPQKHNNTVSRQNSFDEDDCKPLNILIPVKSTDVNEKGLEDKQKLVKRRKRKKVDIGELPYEAIDQTDSKNMRVICRFCHRNLSIRSVDVHMARNHPGKDERKVQCAICKVFVLKEKLNRHTNMMHSTRHFKCRYCTTDFTTRKRLQEHMAGCTAKKQKRKASNRTLGECDICHKIMQRCSLKMHKAITHAGLGPVCEHCGRMFATRLRLEEHCRAKHGYDKLKCQACDFQTSGLVAMRNHARKHRGEKPYQCEACGAKFHASYLLNQHRQTHRTEKLIKCDQCPATFKAKNGLHTHRMSCHSKVMYKCPMCCRVYQCRHYIVKHMRRIHKYTGPVPRLETVPHEEEFEKE